MTMTALSARRWGCGKMANYFPISPGKAAWNSSITQAWDIQEAKAASGKRRTLCQQAYPAWTFKLKFPALDAAQVVLLMNFYAKMKGKWGSFFYKDYTNNHVENVELPKNGGQYYCISNLTTMAEPVSEVENVHLFIDGVETEDFTVAKGIITPTEPPDPDAVVTATYDYYYLVAFNGDLSISQVFNDLYTVSITLEVVRE